MTDSLRRPHWVTGLAVVIAVAVEPPEVCRGDVHAQPLPKIWGFRKVPYTCMTALFPIRSCVTYAPFHSECLRSIARARRSNMKQEIDPTQTACDIAWCLTLW